METFRPPQTGLNGFELSESSRRTKADVIKTTKHFHLELKELCSLMNDRLKVPASVIAKKQERTRKIKRTKQPSRKIHINVFIGCVPKDLVRTLLSAL